MASTTVISKHKSHDRAQVAQVGRQALDQGLVLKLIFRNHDTIDSLAKHSVLSNNLFLVLVITIHIELCLSRRL